MFEFLLSVIIGAAPVGDGLAAVPAAQVRQAPVPQPRTPEAMAAHRARTFEEVGRENGFTWEAWQAFYAKMDGFSTVNGIRLAPSLPTTD